MQTNMTDNQANNNKSEDNSKDKTTEIPEWLNADTFRNILKENVTNFSEVRSFKAIPAVATGENFMTVLLNAVTEVVLKDGSTQQESFIAKIMPKMEKMQVMLRDWKVFDKELNIYWNYIPEFENMYRQAGKSVQFGAKVYTTSQPNVPKELIIMEDLCTKGFKNIKRQEGLNIDHTKNVLEKLAQFHAASACRYEAKGAYPEMYNRCLYSSEDLFADYRTGSAKLLIQSLPLYDAGHLAENLQEFVALVPDQFQAKSKLYPGQFNVLNHGDCWSNNVMFKYNSDGSIADTYFVDFQMSRYGSPAQDLIYLLISSTQLEYKLKYFDYFVSFYHDKLTENLRLLNYGKTLPTLKELHISLFRHGDWAYTVVTTVMPILLLDSTEKASLDNVIDDGEKSGELKKIMFTSNRYIAHMKKLLPWMENRGLLTYT